VFSLNTDYNPTGMNPQLLTALMTAVQSEQSISGQTLYELMQKGEVASTRTYEEEQELIRKQIVNID
jgi:hypothetical protein